MEKELLEILEKLNEKLDKFSTNAIKDVKDKVKEAFNEPAKISIEKDADGNANCQVEGKPIALLITLAGLEKSILEQLDPPTELWELVKDITNTKEVD